MAAVDADKEKAGLDQYEATFQSGWTSSVWAGSFAQAEKKAYELSDRDSADIITKLAVVTNK